MSSIHADYKEAGDFVTTIGDDELKTESEVIIANDGESEELETCQTIESRVFNKDISKLDKYLTSHTLKCVEHIKEDYIREALDVICDTYVDTSYINMANDLVHDSDSDIRENFVVSYSDVDNSTKVQQVKDIITTRESHIMNTSEFWKCQEDEFLSSIYTYQSLLVGLVIVCSSVSAKLSESVQVLESFHSSSTTAFPSTKPSPPLEALTADSHKSPGSKVWNHLKSFYSISEGKKVEKCGEFKTFVAIEAIENSAIVV